MRTSTSKIFREIIFQNYAAGKTLLPWGSDMFMLPYGSELLPKIKMQFNSFFQSIFYQFNNIKLQNIVLEQKQCTDYVEVTCQLDRES